MFRELAISYLGRNDLAHVDPSDIGGTVIGKGEEQSRPQGGAANATQRFVSRGFVRSKTDKLMLVQGGGYETVGANAILETAGATALKKDVTFREDVTSVTTSEFEQLEWSAPSPKGQSVADKRAEARMKGYVGESCPECANFTLVRNGTCLKCDTCGSTTGCS